MPLTVTLAWGDAVLDVITLERGRGLTLGEGTRDFPVPRELLGNTRLELVRWHGALPWLAIPNGARAWRGSVSGGVVAPSVDTAAGTDPAEPARDARTPLALGEVVWATLGTLTITAEHVARESLPPRRAAPAWRSILTLATAVALQLALVAVVAFAVPPTNDGESRQPLRLIAIAPALPRLAGGAVQASEPLPPDPIHELWGASASRAGLEREQSKRPPSQPGLAELPKALHLRSANQGPADNPDPHLARSRAYLEPCCFTQGPLQSGGYGTPNAPISPEGRDSSLGLDEVAALAPAWGSEIGSALGADERPPTARRERLRKVLTFVSAEPLRDSRR